MKVIKNEQVEIIEFLVKKESSIQLAITLLLQKSLEQV